MAARRYGSFPLQHFHAYPLFSMHVKGSRDTSTVVKTLIPRNPSCINFTERVSQVSTTSLLGGETTTSLGTERFDGARAYRSGWSLSDTHLGDTGAQAPKLRGLCSLRCSEECRRSTSFSLSNSLLREINTAPA